MMTRTYPLDARGHWKRDVAEFVEDVAVACRACGAPQDGRIVEHGGGFAFERAGPSDASGSDNTPREE
jgi:hypothetical protein